MRLERVDVVRVPGNPARARLLAEVSYSDRTGEVYWFEVEQGLEDAFSTVGNPWLVCLLPLAVSIGEPLEITLPVDPLLYENAHHLMHVWKAWYPHLHVVPVDADVLTVATSANGAKNAAFFSGGVDSFFSILRHENGQPSTAIRLDELLFVWGADIPLSNSAGFTRAYSSAARAAAELGKRPVPVATNLRETRWSRANWAYLSHGAALGAVALALERRYSNVMVASSTPYYKLQPWGSHPLTDPLFSTSRLRIIHDGAFVSRFQKLRELVHSDVAMHHLRVCWRSETGENCGTCEKCYRTMAMLAALGALDRCATLRGDRFQVDRVARIYTMPDNEEMQELESAARTMGKHDLSRAVRQSMKNSRRLHTILPILRRFKDRPLVHRMANALETRLLGRVLS